MVTACSACLTEACWQGVLMCEDARRAGITQIPRKRNRGPIPSAWRRRPVLR